MLKFFSRTTQAAPQGFAAVSLTFVMLTLATGCSTKNYVKNQTTPVINQTNELDDKTAANNRALNDLDKRTGSGIQNAQSSADTAQQSAQSANGAAGTAQQGAQDVVHRADTLRSVVSNLDTYKQIDATSVNFGFNKSELTSKDKAVLDGLGAQLGAQRSYILSLTGGTDSVGSATYNYELSDRRAQAVVQYLASKYGVPAHRFYLIGLGKDQEVASNSTAAGRAQNRRVTVQLLTNQPIGGAADNAQGTSSPAVAPATGSTQPQ
jgi:OOP family OmpA-OmpF porin